MTEKLVTLFFGVDCGWRQRPKIYDTFCLVPGIYLPLLWEPSFCSRSPISLGYTRGHFCALVPPEPVTNCGGAGGGAELPPSDSQYTAKSAFLPLMTKDRYDLSV